jgi:hypothetical protein
VVLTSSRSIDEEAWHDPRVGGLLSQSARVWAYSGRGKLAGLVVFGDCRPGVPGIDDARAR